MNKFEILSVALEYIEENLTSGVTPEMCLWYVVIPSGNLRYNELFSSFVIAGRAEE